MAKSSSSKISRKEIIKELTELIETPLLHPEMYEELGIPPSKAILLYGVTGAGKTFLIKSLAEKCSADFISFDLTGFNGEQLLSEIKEKINTSEKPKVLYLVMHHPESISSDTFTIITKLLDGDYSDIDLNKTIITGSSIRPSLPPELRRPGRFDKELHLGLPNEQDRFEILVGLTSDSKLKNINLKEIARVTRGYTPADLIQLLKNAGQLAIRRSLSSKKKNGSETEKYPSNLLLLAKDLKKAVSTTEPTVFKEFGISHPQIKWNYIHGQEEVKSVLKEKVIMPVTHGEYFKQAGVKKFNGIILYGPPGNGKTTIAKAVATHINSLFLHINSSEFIGNTGNERKLSQIFDIALEIDESIVLFFDEADGLLSKREIALNDNTTKLVNNFLSNVDKLKNSNVLIITATNHISFIDEAVKRRLELKLLVPPPNKDSRKSAFVALTKKQNVDKSINFDDIVELTEFAETNKFFSFADLSDIVREAGILAAQEAIKLKKAPKDVIVKLDHYKVSILNQQPSITSDFN